MTNPKHTDTSRIADFRFQVSEKMPINHSDLSGLFDHIEALEAEVERLRDTPHHIWAEARDSEWDEGFNYAVKLFRAALGERQ